MNISSELIPVIGISLIAAFFAGSLAKMARVPKVVGYILSGVVLGPTGFNLLNVEIQHQLQFAFDLALGLILFNIGGEFHKEILNKIGIRKVKFLLVFSLLIYLFVFIICFTFSIFSELTLVQRLVFSNFAAFIALAAAPPTTLMVIKEYETEGPVTDFIYIYLAVGTVLAIIGSKVTQSVLIASGYYEGIAQVNLLIPMIKLIWSLVGSILFGLLIGLGFSYWEVKGRAKGELFMALVCVLMLALTLAQFLGLEPLLISMCLGFTLVNSSEAGEEINIELKNIGLSIYAFFFVLAGSHIHLQDQLELMGILGIGYIVARLAAYLLSSIITYYLIGSSSKKIKYLLGVSLFSHAGAAIGIVSTMSPINDPAIVSLIAAIYSSIFVFEILGPIFLRFALIQAAEVKLGTLLRRLNPSDGFAFMAVTRSFLENVGIIKEKEKLETHTIFNLILDKVQVIDIRTTYADILKIVNRFHLPLYPVVSKEDHFEGIISMEELKEFIFDPFLSKADLVIAQDLTHPCEILHENSLLDEALQVFEKTKMEILPVVEKETGRFIGLVRYKDVFMNPKLKESDPFAL